ncbi:MAG: serine/threonine protein kinase, partial [Deltaproteobacteria bacterium]|nr:serine/threonine protein kinase [Deltaproteobacteria bacterium]
MVKGGRSYRVQAQLGRGAFGAVYLAETVGTGLERRVAVKLLRPEKAAEPGLVGRLRDEARMLAAIRHRSIVRVDDLVELDGTWAIVMEYVEGCDLTELLSLRPVPPVAALAITEEVASALHAAAHQAGPDGKPLKLIHRDIKPSNLRITAQGEVKILDFGVARAELNAREEATREAAFGTVPYMAPERFYGEDTHGGDIYALGVTLFEMLSGVKPGKTAMDADRQPPGERLKAQWSWLAEVSQPLHDLVASMLAKKPGDRPTARETARLCATIRASLPGESLDEWAENVVPGALRVQEERRATAAAERTGTILVERSGSHPVSTGTRPRATGGGLPAWVAAPAALLIAGGLAAAIVIPAMIIGFSTGGKGEAQATLEGATASTPSASPPATATA